MRVRGHGLRIRDVAMGYYKCEGGSAVASRAPLFEKEKMQQFETELRAKIRNLLQLAS